MKIVGKAALAMLAALPLMSHAHGPSDALGRAAEQLDALLVNAPQTFQSVNMVDLTQNPVAPAEGAAFLYRSKSRLHAQVMLSDLIPGHAYTVWWMIYNKPKLCAASPCAPGPDFATGRAAVFFASGVIASSGGAAGEGGVANFAFDTDAGGAPTGAFDTHAGPESGLTAGSGFTAEVHLLMIDHGVPTASFENVPGTWPWELSHPRPPGEADVRAALFPATSP